MVEIKYIKGVNYGVERIGGTITISSEDISKLENIFKDYFSKNKKEDWMFFQSVRVVVSDNTSPIIETVFEVDGEDVHIYFEYSKWKEGIRLTGLEYVDDEGDIISFRGDDMSIMLDSIKKSYKKDYAFKESIEKHLKGVKDKLGEDIKFINMSKVEGIAVSKVGNQIEYHFKYPFIYLGEKYIAIVVCFYGEGELIKGIDGVKIVSTYNKEDTEIVLLSEFIKELKRISEYNESEIEQINNNKKSNGIISKASFKGVKRDNNTKESIKKLDELQEYLNIINIKNSIKQTEEFGRVLLVGFSKGLQFYVSPSIIYDVVNNKVVIRKDNTTGVLEFLKEYNNYFSKLISLKENKEIYLMLTMFNSFVLNAFDLRRTKFDERYIKNELEMRKLDVTKNIKKEI